MQSSIYVALSGQVALEKRMDSIANNIANLGTVGFRADGIKFESLISQTASDSVAFASTGSGVKRIRRKTASLVFTTPTWMRRPTSSTAAMIASRSRTSPLRPRCRRRSVNLHSRLYPCSSHVRRTCRH